MAIKTKKEDYINEVDEIHGYKYDYSRVPDYFYLKELIEIGCPEHGWFVKKARVHWKNGTGCPDCSLREKTESSRKKNAKHFLEKAKAKFGDRFDYSKVVYKNEHDPVILYCKEHNVEFTTAPTNHLCTKWGSCPQCNLLLSKNHGVYKMTEDELWMTIKKIHGNTYTYLGFVGGEYTGTSSILRIVCPKHGEFQQRLLSHVNYGHGCRFCGYERLGTRTRDSYTSRHRYSNLYLLRIVNQGDDYLKVGISTDMKRRLRHLQADIPEAEISVLYSLKIPSYKAWDLEKMVHNNKTLKSHKPLQWFRGGTECYDISLLEFFCTAFDKIYDKYGDLNETT